MSLLTIFTDCAASVTNGFYSLGVALRDFQQLQDPLRRIGVNPNDAAIANQDAEHFLRLLLQHINEEDILFRLNQNAMDFLKKQDEIDALIKRLEQEDNLFYALFFQPLSEEERLRINRQINTLNIESDELLETLVNEMDEHFNARLQEGLPHEDEEELRRLANISIFIKIDALAYQLPRFLAEERGVAAIPRRAG